MAENLKPVVISSDGSKHVIATEGEKLDSQFINKETLISSDSDNQLKAGTDGNLFVPPAEQQTIDPATLVSAEAGNTLTTAVDGKLFVPAPAAPDVPTPSELISTDLGNSITTGTDSKLIAKAVSTDANNLIQRGGDNGAHLEASDIISSGTEENLLSVNSVDHRVQLPTAKINDIIEHKLDDLHIVSTDADNKLSVGSDGGAYYNGGSGATVTAGEGIKVRDGEVSVAYGHGLAVNDTTNKLYVNEEDLDFQAISVANTDKILSLSANVLSATVSMTYNAGTGYLTLYGKNGEQLSTAYMPGSTSALISVEVVTDPDVEHPGTWFKYTYSTASGTTVAYVKVPEGSTINAGNGITAVTSEGVTTVSVAPSAIGGIQADAAGIAVKVKANSGLATDSSGLQTVLKNNGGIVATADGLAVDTTLVPTEEALQVLAERVTTAEGEIDQLQEDVADAVTLTTVQTQPDPANLQPGEGALYPAEDLLP